MSATGEILLCDPGYLLFAPVKVPRETPSSFDNGFNRVELRPLCGGTKLELFTIVKGNRKLRLTFKMEPVADAAFGKAWEQSFAFEMMSYPVLTRTANGCPPVFAGQHARRARCGSDAAHNAFAGPAD